MRQQSNEIDFVRKRGNLVVFKEAPFLHEPRTIASQNTVHSLELLHNRGTRLCLSSRISNLQLNEGSFENYIISRVQFFCGH